MSPGVADTLVLRRHLLALDAALTRLERHALVNLDDYLANPDLQWTVERGLLVCTQNVLDIATHVSASAGLDSPDYTTSIDALGRLGMLPRELVQRLRPLAGFRNLLVHNYLAVDPARVHEVLTSRLSELRQFSAHIERSLG
jgi:uncharacterized protein YutE (UPF0331/DUF86 family)